MKYTVEINTKWYEFHQNNSGGRHKIDDEKGIGPNVYIEAKDVDEANRKAEALGIYFDGCANGQDCNCCGDRWYPADESYATEEVVPSDYSFMWHDKVYKHHYDGRIESLNKPKV